MRYYLHSIVIVVLLTCAITACSPLTGEPVTLTEEIAVVEPTRTRIPSPTLIPSETPMPIGTQVPVVSLAPPKTILFIGNSLSYWNDGVDYYLKELAKSAEPALARVFVNHNTGYPILVPKNSVFSVQICLRLIRTGLLEL